MPSSVDFSIFLSQFFELFTTKSFRGGNYLQYLNRPNEQRSGDEAAIVDTAIVGPLLGLLSFSPAERVYNQQRQNGRPGFAPSGALYGTCFIVENKSTSLPLSFDLNDPDSHLSQLIGYMRSTGVYLGWLTNGKQLTLWQLDHLQNPTCISDLDIPAAILDWQRNASTLSPSFERSLYDLFDLCRKESFADIQRLEREIATSFEEWHHKALPLGIGSGNEAILVATLQSLVMELQGDARRILDNHLGRYAEYADKVNRLTDDSFELASQQLKELRSKVISILINSFQVIWGLEPEDVVQIEDILVKLEQDVRAFTSPKEVVAAILAVINAARRRKYVAKPKSAQPMPNLDDIPVLREVLQIYSEKTFAWHQRRAILNHDYQVDRGVYEDYNDWVSLVRETTLGGLDEEQRRDEFALQAAYVVFIRLLLIRVCEDKGVFPHRFISDGGIKHWQEEIERYFIFARGNPYEPLLDMAYKNAQNIYAHFFTGRELFNWYHLDCQRFVMALHRLSRFDFAEVDSDIIGTIYNTYVSRKEKRDKGQYYTPPQIIRYILDTVGYSGKNVIGFNKRLIDPACGSGSFLVEAAKRLVSAYKGAAERIEDPVALLGRIKDNLFGFDLNPFTCYLAEVNLLIQVMDIIKLAHERKQQPELQRFHIYNVDALTPPTGMLYYSYFNTLLAEENDQVDQIKSRKPDTPYELGFAFVVANPPYGASLSDDYKVMLRENWADVFYGQPDTYTFFLKLGVNLLAKNGRLGFITPNTYLMGKNTANLRGKILTTCRIEQIVDLPQGIWSDANVDCVLLFLAAEADEVKRRTQQVQINLLGLHDTLEKLFSKEWIETLVQQQAGWIDDAKYEITIRNDDLLERIENACRVFIDEGPVTKTLRLNDITESTQGIIPYVTQEGGKANLYIKPRREVPPTETDWKPLLDGSAFVGRYELRWGNKQPYLKYSKSLGRPREAKFFESAKLLVQYMRNRALKRRLVATFDDQKFYNRHNFSNIIAKDAQYDLKYILALFNSSLLNYWFARKFDNVNINPSYFRQLPICPAPPPVQATFVTLVDDIQATHAELNTLRARGYIIRQRRDSTTLIDVPYDILLNDLQQADHNFPVLTLYDAKSVGMFSIPDRCSLQATISRNIYIPEKYPTSLVLRLNKLWFEVPDEHIRRYLLGYLKRPRWQGKTWDDIKNNALIPADTDALQVFFTAEAQKQHHIVTILDEIRRIDAEIDERVLDLYGITNAADRQRILGNAPLEDDEQVNDNQTSRQSEDEC
ncbi:MAG: N-6 DNA methylase [Ktedonobacteraceae bacterium]|nr:N-6 DNA methylase [Ktedonobacteraceae bacterium]